jgi:hypothetical protein
MLKSWGEAGIAKKYGDKKSQRRLRTTGPYNTDVTMTMLTEAAVKLSAFKTTVPRGQSVNPVLFGSCR